MTNQKKTDKPLHQGVKEALRRMRYEGAARLLEDANDPEGARIVMERFEHA